ncbi:hypothetical protein ISR92_00215 [Patescibacteria group bacterium]|nr:hypothetical protein [Patescibacteria group bacterium]
MKDKLQKIYKAFILVFKNTRYILTGIVFALFVYLLSVFTNKAEFIDFTIKSDIFNFATKMKLIFQSLLSIDTNFTSLFTFWTVILLAIVAGINIAMLIYLLRRQAKANKEAGASFFGIVAGMFGIGCAACGSVILTSIFGLGFTASLISFLPLDGGEFMILALIVMIISVYYVSKKIVDPMVCKPKRPSEVVE